MSAKEGGPNKLGINKAGGPCIACGKPRATVPVEMRGGKAKLWVHAKCRAEFGAGLIKVLGQKEKTT